MIRARIALGQRRDDRGVPIRQPLDRVEQPRDSGRPHHPEIERGIGLQVGDVEYVRHRHSQLRMTAAIARPSGGDTTNRTSGRRQNRLRRKADVMNDASCRTRRIGFTADGT